MDFFKDRKAQGMTINVVIIAVLALVVLIVLVLIFSGKLRIFGQSTENCGSLGGHALLKDMTRHA